MKWFEYVQRRTINTLMRKSELIQVEQKEVRGMLKITLIVVKNDIFITEVTESMTSDEIE